MRIGSSVLLSKQRCVQSYHWSYMRPLGKLQTIVDELECYECDEIAIIRPVRRHDLRKDFLADMSLLKGLKSMTPISFGGGIRSLEQLDMMGGLPIERLMLTSAFISSNRVLLERAIKYFGRQSIQCLLPIVMKNSRLYIYHCSEEKLLPLKSMDIDLIYRYANEVILHDCAHEGERGAFDFSILDKFEIDNSRLVISGGVDPSMVRRGQECDVASILIDNKTTHQEYSVSEYKNAAKM